jgi:hypothetical protein
MARSGNLYVFLHGLAVIRERPDGIEVVLPRVPGHVFKAGSFLNETRIASKAVLRLNGVDAGQATFQNLQHTILLPHCSLTSRRRAATFSMRKPAAILELLRATGPNLAKAATGSGSWSDLCNMQVLVYNYADENEVYLDGHHWEPCACEGAISLHVVSTSDAPEGADHQLDTERTLRKLIENYPGLVFQKPAPIPPPWNATADPNYPNLDALGYTADAQAILVKPGGAFAFDQAELEPFTTRSVRLNRLGRLRQYGWPLENLWHEPDPLGELPCNCSPVVVRG